MLSARSKGPRRILGAGLPLGSAAGRLLTVALLLLMATSCRAPLAAGAPAPNSLEQGCIAAGTVLPLEMQGFMFNHHPEKKREPRAGDHYQTTLDTVAEFEGAVPRMPAACKGHFGQVLLGRSQFQAGSSPHRWRSLSRRWERLPLNVNTLEFVGDPPPLSSFASFAGQAEAKTFGLGCTLRGRVDLRLEVLDEANDAIVAIRDTHLPLTVDSWFRARCLGRFSIQESSGARHCGEAIGTRAGKKPVLWGVKERRVGCGEAVSVAQKALETPTFLQGELVEQSLGGGWRCYYGHRGAAACTRGSAHVFMVSGRGGQGEDCDGAPKDVRGLSQAGTNCAVAGRLLESVAGAPRDEAVTTWSVGGSAFTCGRQHHLGLGDRLTYDYACAADDSAVSFEIQEPKSARLVPTPPTAIPAAVKLPPSGLLGFPRTPTVKFDYGKVRNGRVLILLTVDPALVGRRAELQIKAGTMSCEWTADPSDTEPTCGPVHRMGPLRKRTVTLQASQQIDLGPNRRHGNWTYEARLHTKPFVVEGLPYTHALGYGFWSVANDATNCSANPWCHPGKKGESR